MFLWVELKWWSEIGLVLDLVAFVLLSIDLVSALGNERQNLDDIMRLERRAFYARYGSFAPDPEEMARQETSFDDEQATKRDAALKSMAQRRFMAVAAIGIAAVGFVMQIIGGWPI